MIAKTAQQFSKQARTDRVASQELLMSALRMEYISDGDEEGPLWLH